MALVVGSNSYGSRTEADTYFGDSIRMATWDAFTNTQKDQGLVEATRILERQQWSGTKEVPSQDLHFPATGIIDCNGTALTADESLEVMKEAQFEYALALLSDPSLIDNRDATGSNTKKLEAGSAKITYFKSKAGTRFPLTVTDLVKCFFKGSGSSTLGSFSSGTGDSSCFTSNDQFNRTKGFN